MSNSEKMQGRILLLCTAIGWGLAGVCVKSVSWGSFSLMAVRSFASMLLLFAVKRSFQVKITKINLWCGIMTALTGILYMEAIKLTSAGTAVVLQYVAPILVYLYGVVFRHSKVKISEIFIIAAVFFGCALSFSDQIDTKHVIGNLLGLLSGFTYAAQIILSNDENADTGDGLIISNILGFVLCTPFMFFDKGLIFDTKNIVWVLILCVFQYGLANVCFSKGIKKVSALEGSLILTIEPIFNPIPVWIYCGEKMGIRAIIGSVIVIGFVTLYAVMSGKKSSARES